MMNEPPPSVFAIALGVTSAEGSPLQLFKAAPGSAAMQNLPWSFVPSVLVPFWLILHAIIWVQLRGWRAHPAMTGPAVAASRIP